MACLLSRVLSLALGKDLTFGVIRSFFQILVIGNVSNKLMEKEPDWMIILVKASMTIIGEETSSKRAAPCWRAIPHAIAAIGVGRGCGFSGQ